MHCWSILPDEGNKEHNMCKDFRYDDNKIQFSGTAVKGTLKFYVAKGQNRCEFMLRSEYEKSITKMVIQFRGQKAHDALMLYEAGREFDVIGNIKYRKGGRFCIVVHDFGVGNRTTSPETIIDLLTEKIDALMEKANPPQVAEDVVEDVPVPPVPYNEILDEAMMEDTPVAEPGMVFVSETHDKIGVPVEVDINGNPMEPIAPEDQEGLMVDREEADGDVS